jgi:segregation and condensation protein B
MAAPEHSEASEAPPPLPRLIEALLFVGGPPLTAVRAAEVVRGLTADSFDQVIAALNRDYRAQGRPYRVRPRDQGYELVLRPRFRTVLERLHGSTKEARLSPPALDTLALVAYRQPLTPQEVESLRGGESAGLLRQLVRLGLVAVRRQSEEPKAVVYVTTSRFLQLFGLRSLDDLPRTQDLQKL